MKRALITGIKGQDGVYLSRLLLGKGYQVFGIDLSESNSKNLLFLNLEDSIVFVQANLLDMSNMIRVIERIEPDEIYNLAAQSSVGLSFEQIIGTLELNIFSVTHLLEAIRIVNPKIKFYQASSSEMFGRVQKESLPVNEESVFHPVSPYGISKCTAHWVTVNYREAYNLFAVCGILFNHESVLRGDGFVTKKIVNTAVRIKMGLADSLNLGNTGISRDWGYAPQYVEAMWLMLQQEKPDDYVICSGQPHSLTDFAGKVFGKLGLDFERFVTIDERLIRPVDLETISGDNSKAKRVLGWNYTLQFDDLIDLLIRDEISYLKWESSNSPDL
ncbi:MAG: GDP-mannose 4,6-dehydratase [Syntrophobacterales bacterium]|jgi:GDPmannose 4,6-dehydratase|nr:GDP-mannose 4,6-dehydratase [Syntrophobacterales bacterium]